MDSSIGRSEVAVQTVAECDHVREQQDGVSAMMPFCELIVEHLTRWKFPFAQWIATRSGGCVVERHGDNNFSLSSA